MNERERIRRKIFNKPKEVAQGPSQVSNIETNLDVNPGLLKIFPPERIKKLMEKEARRYKNALRKKWDRWLEAVSK